MVDPEGLRWRSGNLDWVCGCCKGVFRVSGMADPGRCNGQAILGAWAKMEEEPERQLALWERKMVAEENGRSGSNS